MSVFYITLYILHLLFCLLKGIDEIGIYRVPGITSDVKRLKEKFDESKLDFYWLS